MLLIMTSLVWSFECIAQLLSAARSAIVGALGFLFFWFQCAQSYHS